MTRQERDKLIEQYADGPRRLGMALAKIPPAVRKWRPAPGEWSAHEVICHCADSETASYSRIRMVLAENDPLIVGYDQEEWARKFDYHKLPLEPALAAVAAVRLTTAALLRTLSDADWARKGRHTEMGEYPAEKWLELYAAHLDDHAQQIENNLAAWKKANT